MTTFVDDASRGFRLPRRRDEEMARIAGFVALGVLIGCGVLGVLIAFAPGG